MNAPLPEHLRQALANVTLDDKYSLQTGHAFMSGVQALVRLPMLQQERDAAVGKKTGALISGYRGSPLGGYDQALWKAKPYLEKHNIVFQPGVNEELAATALWGTQQLGFAPPGSQKLDGVFGIWYGKGPGVDRCSDVFKHATWLAPRLGAVSWPLLATTMWPKAPLRRTKVTTFSRLVACRCSFPLLFKRFWIWVFMPLP